MKYLDLSPNLMVKNVKQAIDFYVDLLGFELLFTVPENRTENLDFAMVQSGTVTFMFQEENSLKSECPSLTTYNRGGALTFYIHVSDVHQLYNKLKGKVNIIADLHQTFYGSTDFGIEDCNGFILVFSQNKE